MIEILYEDKDVLAINKPSGLMVHGDNRSKEQTLADLILAEYPKLKNVGDRSAEYEDRKNPKSEIIAVREKQ